MNVLLFKWSPLKCNNIMLQHCNGFSGTLFSNCISNPFSIRISRKDIQGIVPLHGIVKAHKESACALSAPILPTLHFKTPVCFYHWTKFNL